MIFSLVVFFVIVVQTHPADALFIRPDPFGFPRKDSFVSAYSLGPFLRVKGEESDEFAFRPLFYVKKEKSLDSLTLDFLYPFFHYRRTPKGYRMGFFFNSLSFSKKAGLPDPREKSFRIYPLIFHRSSPNPERRSFAFVPFYGNFGGKTKFVLFPFYLRTINSEGAISRNFLWPFFASYSGESRGFRFWPLFGNFEGKNSHSKFLLWPFYFDIKKGSNETYRRYKAFFPFYYRVDYGTESHTMYMWPFFQKSVDPKRNLRSFHLPWPIINFKKSDTERRMRFFPFFETSETFGVKKTKFLLWPLYASSRLQLKYHEYKKDTFLVALKVVREAPFDKTRKRSLRVDLWPVFSYKRDEKRGHSYFHLLAPFEPFIGSSAKFYRNYSFLWRIFEVRRKHGEGTAVSVLFGTLNFRKSCDESFFHIAGKAFGYASDLQGRRIRFLFLPLKVGSPVKSVENCRR